MSEYQYFEFIAVDQPLNSKQKAELRKVSSRAEISSNRFVNEYHYGDFRGNPAKLINEYFDAFLHFANWGSVYVSFRFPQGAIPLREWKRFEAGDAISFRTTGKFTVLDLRFNDEGGQMNVPYEAELDDYLPMREMLLEGDVTPLYIAWLAAIVWRDLDPEEHGEELEPCEMEALSPLTSELKNFARLLDVPDRLLRAAFPGGKAKQPKPREHLDWGPWIAKLSAKEKDAILLKLLGDTTGAARSEFTRQCRRWHHGDLPLLSPGKRTIAQLATAAKLI